MGPAPPPLNEGVLPPSGPDVGFGQTPSQGGVESAESLGEHDDDPALESQDVESEPQATPPEVDHWKLGNVVGALYHGVAGVGAPERVGDGSAMAAASDQVRTGELVYDQDHLVSTAQIRTALERFLVAETYKLKSGKKVVVVRTELDILVATSLIAAINDAHRGEYRGFSNYPGLG